MNSVQMDRFQQPCIHELLNSTSPVIVYLARIAGPDTTLWPSEFAFSSFVGTADGSQQDFSMLQGFSQGFTAKYQPGARSQDASPSNVQLEQCSTKSSKMLRDRRVIAQCVVVGMEK